MHIHQQKLSQTRTVVWLSIKAHYGKRKAARFWQEFLHNEVFMKAGWDAVAVEPNVYHEAGSLNDDDDGSVCVVESRIDVFQDVKAMCGAQSGHQRDGNQWTRSGHRSQDRETSLVLEPSWFHVESKSQTRA